MLDFGNLPSNVDVQIFPCNSTAVGNGWSVWTKPRGCTNVFIFMLGAGGGGGNGALVAASAAGSSGAGGGSGGQSALYVMAALIPDELYVSVARAAVTSAATTAVAGYASYVAIRPGNNAAPSSSDVLLQANAGAAGGSGSGTTVGALGTAGAIMTTSQAPLSGLGVSYYVAGQAGIVGNAAAGGAITYPTTGLVVSGGAAGGGTPATAASGGAGGAINAVGSFLLPTAIAGGTAGTSGNSGGNGNSGIAHSKVQWFTGGSGGGGAGGTSGATGGNGGNGGIGCGGGGGGAAHTTAGVGGKGGDGCVWIFAW